MGFLPDVSEVTCIVGVCGGRGTAEVWSEQELLEWFLRACWVPNPAADFAAGLLHRLKKSYTESFGLSPDFESDFVVAE